MRKKETSILVLFFAVVILFYGFVAAFYIERIDTWRETKSQEFLIRANKSNNNSQRLLLLEEAGYLAPNEGTFLKIGAVALGLGENQLAQRYLDRVKTADGYFQLGNAYFSMGRFDLAAESYQKATEMNKDADYYAGMGKSFLKEGKLGDAQSALRTSYNLKKSKEVGYLFFLAGGQLRELPGLASQLSDYNVSRETDRANKAILIYNALESLGYPQSAISELSNASLLGDIGREGYIELAEGQYEEGDYGGSYKLLLKAKESDRYYPQIYQQLIRVCGKLNKFDEVKLYQAFLNKISF
jgi:tetratricopeptide (TPR) repeat protein